MKRTALSMTGATIVLALVALSAFVAITRANPPTGVTPTLLARGTYPAYSLNTDPHSAVDFKAKTKEPTDVVVQQHDFAPGGSTGWHQHPGPIYITVTKGAITFYERDDPTCSPHVVTAGHGYVDTGMGHIGRNETNEPAQDVAVAIAPVGAPFRTELTAPGPYCNF